MEDENTVNYFLFNDRKSTLRCSFILSCSHTLFEFYSCFICISPLLYPKYNTILFYLLSLSFSNHPYFIATPPPIRLHIQSFHPSFPPSFLFKSPPFLACFSPSQSQSEIFFHTTSIPLHQRHDDSIVQKQ